MDYVIPVNRRKYERAQEQICNGAWVVDPAAGTITSRKTGQTIGTINPMGYIQACVWLPEVRLNRTLLIHRVIWESAHGAVPDGREINHIDGNKANAKISNLELVTHAANCRHAVDTRLQPTVVNSDLGEEIAAALSDGATRRGLARQTGVNRSTITRIDRMRPDYVPFVAVDGEAATKWCRSCETTKPVEDFHRHRQRHSRNGRTPDCASCRNGALRAARRHAKENRCAPPGSTT